MIKKVVCVVLCFIIFLSVSCKDKQAILSQEMDERRERLIQNEFQSMSSQQAYEEMKKKLAARSQLSPKGNEFMEELKKCVDLIDKASKAGIEKRYKDVLEIDIEGLKITKNIFGNAFGKGLTPDEFQYILEVNLAVRRVFLFIRDVLAVSTPKEIRIETVQLIGKMDKSYTMDKKEVEPLLQKAFETEDNPDNKNKIKQLLDELGLKPTPSSERK